MRAWACALGLELHITTLTVEQLNAAHTSSSPHLLILLGVTREEAWAVVKACAPLAGTVLGLLPVSAPIPYAFVGTPASAMELHLQTETNGLEGIGCSRCASLLTAALSQRCLLFGASVEAGTWQVLAFLHEMSATWPIGYRTEERCESIGDTLGLPESAGVQAVCRFHGCSETE